ncbi:MAG: hypothetical protein BGO41_03895 [Clostridiales bacterium 38-18]|nr:MAG: hypothetical protein BGO41_03895 [Clostridiales bacterium 38-18]
MFKRLQRRMTITYSLIVFTIMAATNLSVYFVMFNYTSYQMTSEVTRMLESINSSEWLYENSDDESNQSEIKTAPTTLRSDSNSDSDDDHEDEHSSSDNSVDTKEEITESTTVLEHEVTSTTESSTDIQTTSEVATQSNTLNENEISLPLPEVKDLIIPKVLGTFDTYMIYDNNDQLITYQTKDNVIFDALLIKSKLQDKSAAPSVITISDKPKAQYLVAKMPISIDHHELGYYVVGRNVTIAYETLDNLSRILLVSLFFGVFIAIALGYLLAGRSLKPIIAAYQSKQVFLANASHELKTPLSVILLSTETLDGEINPEQVFQHQVVDGIRDEAQKMSHLVSQLLFLSRTDSHAGIYQYESFDFSDLINKEVSAFEQIALSKAITLHNAVMPNLKIYGDRKQLSSVVTILIDNALKYSRENGNVYVSLEKSDATKKQGIRFTVKDTGIGIPESQLNHIFERFYRLETSRSRETGGHGLGLAIAKEIIEQHKGTITVKSIEQIGTTFTVTF